MIDKRFHGGLGGTSMGSMLTAGDRAIGSAGHVAMEKVIGTLDGRPGSFVLMHHATMDDGAPALSVVVVPGSGADALRGISGRMIIRIEGGRHYYDFDYTLPATHSPG